MELPFSQQIVLLVLTPLLAVIIPLAIRRWIKSRRPGQQKQRYMLSKAIRTHLHDLRESTGVSRAFIYSLHNGTVLKIGELHWDKLSMIYESVDSVVKPILNDSQGLVAFSWDFIIHELANEGYYRRSMHMDGNDEASQFYLEQYKIHDEYLVPVLDREGRVAGIAGCTFHSTQPAWSESNWDELRDLARYTSVTMESMK